jgi:hypothetical protein
MLTSTCFSFSGQSDALSRRSYLAPKEGDIAYDQQHFVHLKLERLLHRIVYTTPSMDPIFLKDICISLLSHLLVLKFKQSCVDFRPQNGQIEVQDSQTPDLGILDLESPDSLNSNSRIHRSHEGEKPKDDIDP